ncbi:hypothetical protein AI29_12050 [bacteria symbiont BFo2 of Frankliniella occidentalis]|nr:hypothetical protein AI29_12050 [bacteria symbiont BFo2 of Frankliniella occidentalis]KYP94478.1 hypothetical protein WB60_01140 [bacteria symbiont BFo2 of Frankliniella occidentalis]KYP95329.1 hypothetical protein WB67_06550 [bacteria symbiont BFo2 of Frankliniella occidentalis]
MNLSEKESAAFLRLSLSQREELSHFPPALRSRTLSEIDSVSSGYGDIIANAKIKAMSMSIIKTGKVEPWNTRYTEQGKLRAENNKAAFKPPVPESMQAERARKRDEEVKELAEVIRQSESIVTSNLNGRGGFGD